MAIPDVLRFSSTCLCALSGVSAQEKKLPAAMNDAFFTDKFKTLWCPVGAQHDWQACLYAHTYQDHLVFSPCLPGQSLKRVVRCVFNVSQLGWAMRLKVSVAIQFGICVIMQ
eukprot:1069764-Amphidinium_carterae.1